MEPMDIYVATDEELEKIIDMPTDADIKIPDTFYVRYGKRIFDLFVSFVGIIVTSPIMLIIAIIVYFEFGAPILFPMDRPGKNGKLFRIYKFHDLNDKLGPDGNLLPPEQRTTPIGRILRASSLDELPQLFNILKGDMSIIGPRPLLKIYLPRYTSRQMMRHSVKPGLECPSMVKRNHPRTWEEQFEDDIWYVEHISFLTDLKMIFGIVKMAFNRKDVKRRGEASKEEFRGTEGLGI